MHKLAKGLKKKKKSKKGKKGAEEDEFDPEELERYRRERAEAQEKAASEATGNEEGGASGGAAGSDEWQKFQALTAGVDSILKKTQGDLDRIKSTSFFQRKAPIEDQKHKDQKKAEAEEEEARVRAKRWVGFDKDGNPIEKSAPDSEDESNNDEVRKKDAKGLVVNEEGFVDVPEDDDEKDDSADEDIFDTTYVDVLQNIDVQLAYIPDSPTEEEIGDDPFDTTNADKVLRTVDKKGNKLVSLGNAVEVLSGRIDHVSTCKISRPRKPPRNQDLLLDDFDAIEGSTETGNNVVTAEPLEVEKTLLDDDSDLPDVPIDLTNLPPVLPRSVSPAANGAKPIEDKISLDISEFEILKEKTLLEEIPDLDDAEFDLNGPTDTPVVLEETEDPFGSKETEQLNFETDIIEASFEVATFVNEEDPFDTTFADNILPGKTELKFIEKELEELPPSEVSISLTDPSGIRRDYETGLLSSDLTKAKQDLLGGSCTDLAQLNDQPIAPAEEITYRDPFDTSGIQELPPGQAELKFLERELLGEDKNSSAINSGAIADDDDDFDFDPRKEESTSKTSPPIRPQLPSQQPGNAISGVNVAPISVKPNFEVNFDDDDQSIDESTSPSSRKPSRPEVLGLGPSKTVAFELPTPSKRPDLLQTSDEEKSISSKPLTPYYSQKSIEETLPEEDNVVKPDVDPFDTSFVANAAPGKTELKLIESELLTKQESKLKHSISDHEFDPRSEIVGESQRVRRQSDFGGTSLKSKNFKSIKPEVSLIEDVEAEGTKPTAFEVNEAVYRNRQSSQTKRQESLLDAEVEVDAKPLTPRIEARLSEDDTDLSYVDPFDTSIATNILPGKAELKLLENELSQLPPEIQQIRTNPIDLDRVSARPASVDDEDDFDPRAGEIKESTDFLRLDGQDSGHKVLTPLNNQDLTVDDDVDPFDTSFASIGPGKTELKLLETELMNQ